MEERTLGYVFGIWVVLSICVRTAFIMYGHRLLSMAGAVLIMLGLMGLMPTLRFTWMQADSPE
jgi:hypothetical protein